MSTSIQNGDLLDDPTNTPSCEVKVYHRRWYILSLFSLLAGLQGGLWNTWGPLEESARVAFDWGTATVALQANWGPVTFIVSTFFFTWLLDTRGLRWACTLAAGLVALGAALRCITAQPPAATWLIHMGQILNGFGGPVAMAVPPALSAIWFPANQRTVATAIGTVSNNLGMSLSFIIGPLLVSSPSNGTASNTTVQDVREQILHLMYIEGGCCVALFLFFIVYFPSAPKLPPSLTASIPRVEYKEGMKRLLRMKRFWILSATYAISTGLTAAWASVLAVILQPVGVDQIDAGWVGFYGGLAGIASGIIIGIFSDIFSRHLKVFLLGLFSVTLLAYIVFALACLKVIPFHMEVIYASNIAAGIGISGGIPLMYEMVCESAYPVAEGVTNGLMTWLNNVVALVFYLIMLLPIGTQWMTWTVIGCIAACIPVLYFYKETYARFDIDTKFQQEHNTQSSNNADTDTEVLIQR